MSYLTIPHAAMHDCDCADCAVIERDRLRSCLENANAQAEKFERLWYLRGDVLEKVRNQGNLLLISIAGLEIAECTQFDQIPNRTREFLAQKSRLNECLGLADENLEEKKS